MVKWYSQSVSLFSCMTPLVFMQIPWHGWQKKGMMRKCRMYLRFPAMRTKCYPGGFTMSKTNGTTTACTLCPRRCGADRAAGEKGFCGETVALRVGRAGLHLWEEPCITGKSGSGTVFFAGCTLRCVYCQNHELLRSGAGILTGEDRLVSIFFELAEKGASNINLVTPDHFIPQIVPAVRIARENGLSLPFVWNLSGYETVEQIRMIGDCADVYLTDLKYLDPELAAKYSYAPDYPETAKAALAEMVRRRPFLQYDADGLLREGVIVRHLLLPSHVNASKAVLRYLHDTYDSRILVSIMNQYTPRPGIETEYPELERRVTKREYDRLVDYAISLGMENAFIQEGPTALESFIPAFDGEGV